MDQVSSQYLWQALAAVGAFLGAMPALIKLWSDRSRRAERSRLKDEISREMEFLEVYLRVSEQALGSNGAEAIRGEAAAQAKDLVERYNSVHVEPAREGAEPQRGVSRFRRFFLLYWPVSAMGLLLHTLYYMWSLIYAFMLLGLSLDDANQPSFKQFFSELPKHPGGTAIIISFLIWLGLRALAARAGRPRGQATEAM